jgi:hypothetical protein
VSDDIYIFNLAHTGGYVYQEKCYQIFENYFLKYNAFYDIFDDTGKDL